MIIDLDKVVYHPHARSGQWCTLPYPGHPKGCPNFPRCIDQRKDFRDYSTSIKWKAVVVDFDLKDHAMKMKLNHPWWSEKQCRNVLYWQNKVRAELKWRCREIAGPNDIILDIPEACGVNLFMTMKHHGIYLKPRPDLVRKIMMVGKTPSLEEYGVI